MTNGWIVGLGEVLWDLFPLPDGPKFGGAPANFAYHAHALGANVAMVSAVGPESDPLASDALRILREHGIDTRGVARNALETGRVHVELDNQGHPTYRFSKHPAWDAIEWNAQLAEIATQCVAVCFGTLAQRAEPSASTIARFVSTVPEHALKIFDVNLRGNFWTPDCIVSSLKRANVFKLSSDELQQVADACEIPASMHASDIETLKAIRQRFDLHTVALTRGGDGATLVTADDVDECPAAATTVRDTVGAGDSYTAVLALGLLNHWPLKRINQCAVTLSAYVCSQTGATPELLPEFKRWFALP